ncbi:PolC-type DNA polymerase III N-terminal domain-containing protein [Butyrivibrio sp. LC3010]|uniref:PolC-type DNA polymerase III N-terminal domain-containing protein n=1 Tax=Butyrivibrio sp. LC3010 TaxID=1280680 RepID=UPI0004169C4D|nr:PolC-type DNA polymerase III N-terminal domain-containing protein [Butyrivibrio sp. LC3010]
MNRPFFTAFPTLKIDDSLKKIFEKVIVEKVSATKSKDFLRIYIRSQMLIEKPVIYQMEKAIKDQMFPDFNITVKIYERFELSSQYTTQNLMELYLDSIMLEIQRYDAVEYTLLKRADFDYPEENKIRLCLEESVSGGIKVI